MRYTHQGGIGFGAIAGDIIHVHSGAMFGANNDTGATLSLRDVRLLRDQRARALCAGGA